MKNNLSLSLKLETNGDLVAKIKSHAWKSNLGKTLNKKTQIASPDPNPTT